MAVATEAAGKAATLPTHQTALHTHLTKLATDPEVRIFAVMDGAFFDSLPGELTDAGLSRRALYRHGGNYAVVVGGPWLVNLYRQNPAAASGTNDEPPVGEAEEDDLSDEALKAKSAAMAAKMNTSLEAGDPTGGGLLPIDDAENVAATVSRLEAILRIAGEKPGLVFWIGDASLTEEALFRHLRGLNKILIPREYANPDQRKTNTELVHAASDSDAGARERSDTHELVIFRHADANVMMQILPGLDAAQFARLFGPANQILYAPEPEWGGGVKRAQRAEDLPKAPSGPLRFTSEQMAAQKRARLNWLTVRTALYLREHCGERTAALTDQELGKQTRTWLRAAQGYGVSEESAFRKWCYMQAVTGGKLEETPGTRQYMAASNSSNTANERVHVIMRETVSHLRGV